jgi:hypothetical protein
LITNFTEDIDISFKRETTDAPVKETKIEVINIIKADSIDLDASISFGKGVLEIINLYKKSYFRASVKNKIMKTLLNEEFLKTNLLHSAQHENKGAEHLKLVLLIFREKKYKNLISNDITFNRIEGRLMTSNLDN